MGLGFDTCCGQFFTEVLCCTAVSYQAEIALHLIGVLVSKHMRYMYCESDVKLSPPFIHVKKTVSLISSLVNFSLKMVIPISYRISQFALAHLIEFVSIYLK